MESSVIVEIYKHLFIIGKLVYDNYFNSGGSSVSAGFTLAVSALVSGLLAAGISIWGNARQQDKNIKLSLLDDLFKYKYLLLRADKTKLVESLCRVPIIFSDDVQISNAYENLAKAIEHLQKINRQAEKVKLIEQASLEKPKVREDLIQEVEMERDALYKLKKNGEDATDMYVLLLKAICQKLNVKIKDWDTEKIMRVIEL